MLAPYVLMYAYALYKHGGWLGRIRLSIFLILVVVPYFYIPLFSLMCDALTCGVCYWVDRSCKQHTSQGT